jgi:NADPH-dependent 2,4-dienoyl-CoA reductase/sulfur reductase-like enzyme
MEQAKYLIVGGGLAADGAVEGIRQLDPQGRIIVLAAEPDPPYTRPWLSKGLWSGKPYERVFRGTDAKGADVRLGRRAARLEPQAKRVVDEVGNEFGYERLLLATGGRVRRMAFGGDEVLYFRTLADYRRLRRQTNAGDHFAVIGGGFIGTEIAAALSSQGKQVTLIFPHQTLAERVFPRPLAEFVSFYYAEKGVALRPGASVSDVRRTSAGLEVELKDASGRPEALRVDGVVAGIGIVPDVDLAESAGLTCEDGIVVDRLLRTSHPDVFAAGDVASFVSEALGRRMRVEHEDNALTMGRQAGRNMAGAAEPYTHLPYFYSDLFDLGYEAVGDLDPRLTVVSDWAEPYRKGVVYYTESGRVRGVLLWNVWDQVPAARALIRAGDRMAAGDLPGRIPIG